jgi:prepilin-type processing-associated H-X9-DG protein
MKRHGAFTLTELLVLVGVSGILGALLLPSLAADKRIAVRAACAQNERQLALAWHLFATDHNGKVGIVAPNGGAGWLWDISTATRDNLVNQYGVPRKVFYCPSYPGHNMDAFWTCPACGGSQVGYWLLVQRVDTNFQPVVNSPWGGQTMISYGPDDPKYKFVYDLSHSSDPNRPVQVLLTDAIISDSVPNFSNIFSSVGPVPLQSPHLGTNSVPEGSNICYTDGHVEWKDMSILKRRFTPGGPDPNRFMWW